MKTPSNSAGAITSMGMSNPGEGETKNINPELWQACAGPLVNLPVAGTHVVYFPQGHSEQVAASMRKDVDSQIPNYPNLASKLLCLLHNVTLHADPETDEVYAQMTLQPVPSFDKDALLRSDLSMKANKPQTEFFCKTLTASDTSTHGGFSVPRRAAEKIFPPLDFTMQPPAQEIVARDLHDTVWTFRHIFRGQPKRHLLTTGWSLFVSGKRLFAGDSVLFIRDEKQQLLLGIRRANRQPTNLSSSVLSSDSMHIGILAAAAHAAANNSPFTIFYNPRTSPSEFVIPLAKYYKSVCSNQISLGMRFRMMFETEESGTRRYMGTITGISDLDSVRWKNSQWRNLQVGWDESTAGEKRNRVSIWEIEPVTAPFFICPTPSLFRPKRPRQPGMPDDDPSEFESLFKRTMPWLNDDPGMKDPQGLHGLSLFQWMNMQQTPSSLSNNSLPPNYLPSLSGSVLQNYAGAADLTRQLGLPASQFTAQRPTLQPQLDHQLQNLPAATLNQFGSFMQQPQQQFADINQQPPKQNLMNQTLPSTQIQSQTLVQTPPVQNHHQNHYQQQQQIMGQNQQQNVMPSQQIMGQNQQQNVLPPQQIMGQNHQQNVMPPQLPDQINKQLQMSENQHVQLQLLQKLQQQQQRQAQDQQRQLMDMSQSFPRSVATTTQLLEPQMIRNSNNSITSNNRFSHLPQQQQQPKTQQQLGMLLELPGHMVGHAPVPPSNQFAVGGGHSGVTDDFPSCSTSPSTNNCPSLVQPNINNRAHRSTLMGGGEEMTQSNGLETMSVKNMQQKPDLKPSLANPGLFAPQTYPPNAAAAGGTQMDHHLDSSSSATSVCLSQNDVHLNHHHQNNNNNNNNNQMSFNQQSMLFRDTNHDGDPRNNTVVPFGGNIDDGGQLGMMQVIPDDSLLTKGNSIASGGGEDMLANYENPKDTQPELSSSMVSQSFGVPDMTFNSIDSTINDSSFLNRGAWAPPPQPQFQRLRTFTKVYKRGAVGRSIDIARYSGYEELKQDLARRFGIEGQLEDRQRVGWKLVYVDHENDVLLVGDDPWEEFVSCVRCIKILSPQEVQQMSLDGDFGNNVLQNQACSSSDGV